MKLDTNSALPILKVVLYGPQSLDEIQAIAETEVQRALQSVDGVAAVGLSGGPTREIWVQVTAWLTIQLGWAQSSWLKIANNNQPIASPIHLNDVATISDTHAPLASIDRYNGTPAVTLSITKRADANTISVSKGVRKQIAALQPLLPPAIRLEVVTDLATYTQQSFNTVQRTLIEAVLLTGIILMVFLHTWRSTFIVLLAIPTSVITTFGLIDLRG